MNPYLVAMCRNDETALGRLLNAEDFGSKRDRQDLEEALRVLVGTRTAHRKCQNNYGLSSQKLPSSLGEINTDMRMRYVEMLLLAGVNTNIRSWNGDPILIETVTQQDLPMMNMFLEYGCDTGMKSDDGKTALHIAASAGYGEIVGFLLASGANPNVHTFPEQLTVLGFLCNSATGPIDSELLDMLLIESDVNAGDQNGRRPLHHLSYSGACINSLRKLVSCDRVNINVADCNGCTPLMYSVMSESINVEKVKLLISDKCNINQVDLHGESVLHQVCRHHEGDKVIQFLIDSGADVNLSSAQGKTPIYVAASVRNGQCVLHLLQANAKVLASYDEIKLEPLHLINQGRAIMTMLILCGQKWDSSPSAYKSPRNFCLCSENVEPNYSEILSGDTKTNYEERVCFVEQYIPPCSLKHRCRLAIRRSLQGKGRFTDCVEKLAIPKALIEYVSMSELHKVYDIFD